RWRGMSWLTPVLREIQADTATTRHKQKFFENGTVLYRIAPALADCALDIRSAKVATLGHEVVDTFHVVGGDGPRSPIPSTSTRSSAKYWPADPIRPHSFVEETVGRVSPTLLRGSRRAA